MFIEALFTIARTWNQPRSPSTDEWIKKLWFIYTMEYYPAIKRSESESVLVRRINQEPVIQSEVSQKENKYCIYINTYKWNLEKWYRWTYLQVRNRDADIGNTLVDTAGVAWGKEGWDELREYHWNTYTTICKIEAQLVKNLPAMWET